MLQCMAIFHVEGLNSYMRQLASRVQYVSKYFSSVVIATVQCMTNTSKLIIQIRIVCDYL